MDNQKILTDLFYQLTDFTRADVEWVECRDALNYDLDFTILRVKLKDGRHYEVMNQFGTVHLTEI